MSRGHRTLDEAIERVIARFAEALPRALWLEADRALAAPLAIEARPVVEALLEALAVSESEAPSAADAREAVTLASLLGRRAAVLDATPTVALALAPAIVEAVGAEEPRARSLTDALRAVSLEGYVAAREERLEEAAARRLGEAIAVVEIAPGCLAVFPAGDQDPGELDRALEAVGRRMLERDARACLVHVGSLRSPSPELARVLFAMHATATMLGARCVFTGVTGAWTELAREAGTDVSELRIEHDLVSGLRAALEPCGLEVRARAGFGEVLRRFVGNRKPR